MSKTLEDDADPTYTHFAHRDDFLAVLERFLAIPIEQTPKPKEDEAEEIFVKNLGAILDHYLPLPGLLDPHLDQIVPPLMEKLTQSILNIDGNLSATRLQRLGRVINWVIKVRGWKATIIHFPSTISYLPILASILSPPDSPSSSSTALTPHHPLISGQEAWEIRSVLLIWLALLLTVPFALASLECPPGPPAAAYGVDIPAQTVLFPLDQKIPILQRRVCLLAIPILSRPGKEGVYAALLLSRVFSRSDAVTSLPAFLRWVGLELEEGDRDGEANLVGSILDMLAVLPTLLAPEHLDLLRNFMEDTLLPHLRGSQTAASSGLIRKLAVKARGRWWMAKLAGGLIDGGLEEALDDLMTGLGDKDTIVRYSCAKYLARIASILPPEFAEQIASNTIDLFDGTAEEPVILTSYGAVLDPGGSNSIGGTMGFGGLEVVRGEARWHGVCLAVAELARRGLLPEELIGRTVEWVIKALTFDIRKASHSIGANVRDAAAYVLWSLSRACSPSALEAYAEKLATSMISVACFDREVGVRRAASAAFQEGVGRMGIYPEGIDVLGKTDFFSVSVRRIAFQNAATSVARHTVYRSAMRDHLHHITLRHWDLVMRSSAAVALRELVQIDMTHLDDAIDREILQVSSVDYDSVQGALAALAQLALLLPEKDLRRQNIFSCISNIRPACLISPSANHILIAACEVIVNTLEDTVIQQSTSKAILDRIIETSMKRKESECQEAVAKVYRKMSEMKDCTTEVQKLLGDLKSTRAAIKQCASLCLGSIQYTNTLAVGSDVCVALLGLMDPSARADVETRRYAIRSLASICTQVKEDGCLLLPQDHFQQSFEKILSGLNDYTTDQRGDVGSWIRAAALEALGTILAFCAETRRSELLSQSQFDKAVGGMISLAVEKLEPVRAAAGRAFFKMREAGCDKSWKCEGMDCLKLSRIEIEGEFRHVDQPGWYASAMPLFRTKYRSDLMMGLALSMGTQVDSTARFTFAPFVQYMDSLDSITRSKLWGEVLDDLGTILSANFQSNRVFIPTLQTVCKLVKMESLVTSESISADLQKSLSRILAIACKGVGQIKAIERISWCMKLCMAILISPLPMGMRLKSADSIPLFLDHRFPRIRSTCGEQLYLAVLEINDQIDFEGDTDLEDLLLETDWNAEQRGFGPTTSPESVSARVVELLKMRLGVQDPSLTD